MMCEHATLSKQSHRKAGSFCTQQGHAAPNAMAAQLRPNVRCPVHGCGGCLVTLRMPCVPLTSLRAMRPAFSVGCSPRHRPASCLFLDAKTSGLVITDFLFLKHEFLTSTLQVRAEGTIQLCVRTSAHRFPDRPASQTLPPSLQIYSVPLGHHIGVEHPGSILLLKHRATTHTTYTSPPRL